MVTRRERAEMFARRRAEQQNYGRDSQERERLRIEKQRRIEWADEDSDQLCILSEIAPDARATTIEEEIQSARMFAKPLGVEEIPAMRVYDFLKAVCDEWRKQGSPLLNQLSGRFSPHFYREDGESFEKSWRFLEPAEYYNRPLSDFPTKEPQEPPVSDGAAVQPETAEEKFNEWQAGNGKTATAFFSSQVMPHAGDK
jgi:hypothetical protein